MKLTAAKVKNAPIGDKPYSLSDGHGLYLYITPAGGKLWRWNYRFEGKQKTMAFGPYPEIPLQEAREKHTISRKILMGGTDPMENRKAGKIAGLSARENSFRSIAMEWHEHWSLGKDDRHSGYVLRRMEADIFPAIGSMPINEIEAPMLVAMARTVEKRGAHDVARRALSTAGQVFRYALAHGRCTRNPAADFRPADVLKTAPTSNYARIEARDLPKLLTSIEVYQGTHVTRLAMKLMAHTFLRTSELIGGEWKEVDFDRKRWDIPPDRMKRVGAKSPHIIPLSVQSVEILNLLHHLTGNGPLMFPGERSSKKSLSNNTILKALERMGYKHTMTGHGFRGLASTVLHEEGFEHEHIELQLAHMPRNAVSAAYNHAKYLKPRTEMMQWWSDYLEKQQKRG